MFLSMFTSRPHSKSPNCGGFTLAELLVVILIIGIMLAVALPSLTNITGVSKLDAAANAVHSAVKLARQYALTHNQPTYLVFHDDLTATGSDSHMAYRAYAVFTINTHANTPGTTIVPQKAGYYLTGWEMLPVGVVFDGITGGKDNIFQPTTDGSNPLDQSRGRFLQRRATTAYFKTRETDSIQDYREKPDCEYSLRRQW
jgi:prepilin-type N-terminal cleavage/methylation domain-containing protein